MALTHNSTLQDNEPGWGSVDKTRLPRGAFADQGEPDAKSSWSFPHHWVQDGGELDENGVYTTGNMYLHSGGLNAAWAAANGARGGEEASAAVKAHLQAHRRAIGLESDAIQAAQEKREVRAFRACELRVEGGADKTLKIRGHAAVFNQLSEELGFFEIFRERVLPGAFARSIKDGDIRSLFNHDTNIILGRTKSGTLKLSEDDVGLAIENALPDTQTARDLAKSIERRDIDQMSFGFVARTDSWKMEDGVLIRELVDVDLFDVSPVTFAAYPETDVALRSLQQAKKRGLLIKQPGTNEEFRARAAARQEFLRLRTPPPDPFCLKSALEKATIKKGATP